MLFADVNLAIVKQNAASPKEKFWLGDKLVLHFCCVCNRICHIVGRLTDENFEQSTRVHYRVGRRLDNLFQIKTRLVPIF